MMSVCLGVLTFSHCSIYEGANATVNNSSGGSGELKRSNRYRLNDRRSQVVCNWWRSIILNAKVISLRGRISPTKRWESGLTSQCKKFMARQCLCRRKRCVFILFYFKISLVSFIIVSRIKSEYSVMHDVISYRTS